MQINCSFWGFLCVGLEREMKRICIRRPVPSISERIRGETLMRSTLYVFVLQTSNLFCTALPSLYSFSFCLTVLLYIFIVVIKGIAANFFFFLFQCIKYKKEYAILLKISYHLVYAVLMQNCLSPWLQMINNPCVVWSCSHTPSMCALRLADTHLLGYLALNAQCW